MKFKAKLDGVPIPGQSVQVPRGAGRIPPGLTEHRQQAPGRKHTGVCRLAGVSERQREVQEGFISVLSFHTRSLFSKDFLALPMMNSYPPFKTPLTRPASPETVLLSHTKVATPSLHSNGSWNLPLRMLYLPCSIKSFPRV